ncbi:MAG: ABC transporter substrate-binding protein [Candidatus Cloacimonetes bacterium]|nr:ABC transporter substrate-binding protein [Candidatus Cloacimonadota bacterium]
MKTDKISNTPAFYYSVLSILFGCSLMLFVIMSTQLDNTPFASTQVASATVHDEPPFLNVWVTYNSEQYEVYKKLVKTFEDRHKVTIKVSKEPHGGFGDKLFYACSSNTAPDIARLDIGLVPKFAVGKALVPFDDLGIKELEKDLFASALDSGKVRVEDGSIKTFGIPDEFTTLALFYNKDLFEEAGLDPHKPPRSWDEFIEYSKKLTKDLDGDGLTDQYAFAMENTLWWSLPFLYSHGANIVDEKSLTCLLDSKEAIQSLEFQLSLHNNGFEAGSWRKGSITPDSGFKSSRFAMIFSGPWNLANFSRSNINYGVALIPGNPDLGIKSTTNVGGNANVILKSTKSPKLAFKFLSYLASEEVQKILVEKLNAVPIHLGLERNGVKMESKELQIFAEQAKYAVARPKIPGYDKIENIVNSEVETAFNKNRTAKEAYQRACKKLDKEVFEILR